MLIQFAGVADETCAGRAMAEEVGTVIEAVVGARLCWETVITTDHNHVSLERHGERESWIHRKGAMPETGNRISRLNPKAEWITKEVASLRMVSDELWNAA